MTQQSQRRLKVSILASDLSIRGAGRWAGGVRAFLLAQALEKLDFEVEILGLAFLQPGEVVPAFTDSGFTVKAFPCSYHQGAWAAARQLLGQLKGDLIYATKPKPSSFGLALLHQLRCHRPLLLDIDDLELSWFQQSNPYRSNWLQLVRDLLNPKGALRFLDHPLYIQWLQPLIRRADGLTTNTYFLQRRYGGTCVPSGKDTDLFAPDVWEPETSRRKYGLTGYRVLMFPGAPRPYKGVEDVLAALELLGQEDLRLVIVGGSPYDDYDKQLWQRWTRWLIMLPTQKPTEMPAVVAAAHVIVVPQQDVPAAQAQFPLKLMDGMALAKPILATRVGDIPDILGDTGFLVEPQSPQQLAATIDKIFNDWDFALSQGQRARERCLKHYSLDSMAVALGQAIDPLLRSHFAHSC